MRFSSLPLHLASALALLSACLAPACNGQESDSAPLGVNDVRKACEVRRTWKAPTGSKCITCQSTSVLADCGCEAFKDYAAKCVAPQDAVKAEASCTDQVQVCVKSCQVTDCDCIDACYVSAEACKRAAGGRDGCVAEVCAPYCNE